MKGAEVARKILDANGLYHVNIEEVRGVLSDHYDPRTKTVRLSSDNFHGHSIAAAAIAAHECGHAIQDDEAYAFLRLRQYACPCSKYWFEFFLDINSYWNVCGNEWFCIAWNCFYGSSCSIPSCYTSS